MEAQLNWQSSLLPIQLTVNTSSHIKEMDKTFIFLLELLLYTRAPAAMGKVSTRGFPLRASCSCWVALVKPRLIDEASAQGEMS